MNSDPPICEACGAVLDSATPGGLCPRCLMAGAMQPTEPSAGIERPGPPSIEDVQAAFPQLAILEFVGQGGMGWVFKARQSKLNRLVALKLLPSSLAERDAAFAGRFEREGQLLARLHHPNIVAVHDSGAAGDFFYLLMEFVEGVNLRQAMRSSRFTPAQALAIVPHICDALQFAHEEGVLHRDIKPENILLDAKGRVKLVDFGIAKLMGTSAEAGAGGSPEDDRGQNLTQSGATLGTPSYMAPEQRDTPADVDHRADIYSLGVVFYELLTGELPTGSFSPPSAKSATDSRVDAIVQQALEKERTRRQSSAGEMKTQVETVSGAPAQPPREHNLLHLEGITRFQSVTALRFAQGACAGFLGFLGYIPGWAGMFGFFGFFGLLGIAYIIEALSRRKDGGPGGSSDQADGPARFSRVAIIAAGWITLCLLVVPPFIWHETKTHEFERAGPFTNFAGVLVFFILLVPAFSAPMGATLLGWIGVSQINRSRGKLYGMWLAVFDGLFFPLLVLDTVLGGLVWALAVQLQRSLYSSSANAAHLVQWVFVCAGCGLLTVANVWITRLVWRAANAESQNQPAPSATKPQPPWVSGVALFFAGLSGVLGAVTFRFWPNPPEILVWSILVAAMIGIALGVIARKSRLGKQAIVVGSINAAIWLTIAAALQFPTSPQPPNGKISEAEQLDPGTPPPALPSLGGSDPEVLKLQLQQAKAEAAREEESYNAGMIDAAEYQASKDKVAILEATMTGDAVQIASSTLQAARRQLELKSKLMQAGVLTDADYEKAKDEVAIDEVKLKLQQARLLEADADATTAKATFGPPIDRVIELSNPARRALNLTSGNYLISGSGRELNFGSAGTHSLRAAGVDLYAEDGDAPSVLKTLDMRLCVGIFSQAGNGPAATVDTVAADDVAQSLAHMDAWQTTLENAGAGVGLQPPGASISGTNLYLFITRYRRRGALQITGLSNNPPSVTIRYKLLQSGSSQSDLEPNAVSSPTPDIIANMMEKQLEIIGTEIQDPDIIANMMEKQLEITGTEIQEMQYTLAVDSQRYANTNPKFLQVKAILARLEEQEDQLRAGILPPNIELLADEQQLLKTLLDIQAAQDALASLKTRYSDAHPKVIMAKTQLDALQKQAAVLRSALRRPMGSNSTHAAPGQDAPPISDPVPGIEAKVAEQELEQTLIEIQDAQLSLADASQKYASAHPRIIEIKSKLKMLEDQADQLRDTIRRNTAPANGPTPMAAQPSPSAAPR